MAWPVRAVQSGLPRRPASTRPRLGADNGLDVGYALIYHVPGRPAVSVTATTVLRIAEQVSNLGGIKHAANGRWEEARKPHFDLFELNQAIFFETNPIPLKSMMAPIGLLETSEARLPLVPVDKERRSILEGVLRRAGLLGIDRVEVAAGRTGHG